MAVNLEKQEYAYVPGWLARHIPCVAALEDNPLYLRLRGLKYPTPQPRILIKIGKRIRLDPQILVALGMLIALMICYFYIPRQILWISSSLIVLIGCVLGGLNAPNRGNISTKSLNKCLIGLSQAGHLTDFCLAMDAKRFVDALAGARILPSHWAPPAMLLIGCITCGILAPLAVKDENGDTFRVIYASTVCVTGLISFFVHEWVIGVFNQIDRTVRITGCESGFQRTATGLRYDLGTLRQILSRLWKPILVAAGTGFSMWYVIMRLCTQLGSLSLSESVSARVFWLIFFPVVWCAFLIMYWLSSRGAIQAARKAAIECVAAHWTDFLQAYPPAG